MAHFGFFGFEIGAGAFGDGGLAGDAFDDANAGGFELVHFFGIIGEQADFAGAEFFEDFGGEAVFAGVGGKAEGFVGFDGVQALVLQLIGAEFIHEADAAAFLGEIDENAAGGLADFAEGEFELGAAIAALGAEHVTGEALGMDAHEGCGAGAEVAADEGDGFFLWAAAGEAADGEAAPLSGERGGGHQTGCGVIFGMFLGLRFGAHRKEPV